MSSTTDALTNSAFVEETNTTPARTSLSDLPLGASASIQRIECERALRRRLMEMGLLPGTRVTLVRIAPLGDPMQLRVRGYALSLRKREASRITVSHVSA